MIIAAEKSDAELLTKIALISKGFWGYSDKLIQGWRNDLTVSPEMISSMNVFKFIDIKKVTAGFYILNQPEETSIELEFLFILPRYIGKGTGKELIHHAFEIAKNFNCKSMNVLADPYAEYFYKSQGFITINKKESSVKGRFLPVMTKLL